MLTDALAAIDGSIDYVNDEVVESRDYGHWVPNEYHAAGLAANPRPAIDRDLAYLAARVREERTVLRFGMVTVRTMSPVGVEYSYRFGGDALAPFNGARVWVHFDPFDAEIEATVTLARAFHDEPAGTVICRNLQCLSSYPKVAIEDGVYSIQFADGMGATELAKKRAMGTVRRELRAVGLDGRRVKRTTISARASDDDRPDSIGAATEDGSLQPAGARRDLPEVRLPWEMAAS